MLVLQIRDRQGGAWELPYLSDDISDHATKPFLLLQHNWFKMMEFFQNDMLSYYTTHTGVPLYKVSISYSADKEQIKAALNFHLTKREEKDIMRSINSPQNELGFQKILELFAKKPDPIHFPLFPHF